MTNNSYTDCILTPAITCDVVMASSFVALTLNLEHEDMAVAISGLYLAVMLGRY